MEKSEALIVKVQPEVVTAEMAIKMVEVEVEVLIEVEEEGMEEEGKTFVNTSCNNIIVLIEEIKISFLPSFAFLNHASDFEIGTFDVACS